MTDPDSPLVLGDHRFTSRLFVGTGKYADFETMRCAHEASGTECVTVAVRRVDLSGGSESLLDYIDRDKIVILPNTAGCFSAKEAIRTAMLAREAGLSDLIKLEVLGSPDNLLPDPIETLEAARVLVAEGFTVLAYTSDDPIIAARLEEVGVTSVMPLGSPIGSGQGILNPRNIRMIKQAAGVPIIVDAGVGTASDVTLAFELGIDGVLLNTGIALADDPVMMASAMKHAAVAGRQAYLAGRMPRRETASASSPMQGRVAPPAESTHGG